MADTIERLEVLIEASTASFEKAMGKLGVITQRGLKPVAQSTKEASVQMELLSKNAEYFGKVLGVGFAAREIRTLGIEFARTVHEAATGASDFNGFVTSDMIAPLSKMDGILRSLNDAKDKFFLSEGVGWGYILSGFKDPQAGADNPFDNAGSGGITLDQKAADKVADLQAQQAVQDKLRAAVKAAADAFDTQNKALEEQLFDLKASDREIATYAAVMKLGEDATVAQRLAIYDNAAALFDQRQALQANSDAANLLADSMSNSIMGIVDGSETAGQALQKLVQQIAAAALQAELLGTGPLAGLFGTAPSKAGAPAGILGGLASAFVGALPHFAGGGTLGSGQVGLVGERGPELIRGPATISPLNGGGQHVIVELVESPMLRGVIRQEATGVSVRITRSGIDANEKAKSRQQALAA